MKVLITHNFYQQPGGEDEVFYSEENLLRAFGHEPITFKLHNDEVRGMNRANLIGATDLESEHASANAGTDPHASAGRRAFSQYVSTGVSRRLLRGSRRGRGRRADAAQLPPHVSGCRILSRRQAVRGLSRQSGAVERRSVHGCYRSSALATAVVAATFTVHRICRNVAGCGGRVHHAE